MKTFKNTYQDHLYSCFWKQENVLCNTSKIISDWGQENIIQATQHLKKKNRTRKRNRNIKVYARHEGKGEMIGEGLLDQIDRVNR